MSYSTVDLYYESFGQGYPVIFLHGFALSHVIWEPVIPYLKKEARLILPDLCGHGNSPAPEGPYTVRGMAEDVLGLMDSLKLEKAIWAGHSMGGYICQAAARHYPDRLAGLVFTATRAGNDSPEKRAGRAQTIAQIRTQGIESFAEDMAQRLTDDLAWQVPLFEIIRRSPISEVIGSLQAMADRPDSTELVRTLTLPWVFVAGRKDQLVSVETAREMAGPLPATHYIEAAGAGHMPMLEAPEQVARAVRILLAQGQTAD